MLSSLFSTKEDEEKKEPEPVKETGNKDSAIDVADTDDVEVIIIIFSFIHLFIYSFKWSSDCLVTLIVWFVNRQIGFRDHLVASSLDSRIFVRDKVNLLEEVYEVCARSDASKQKTKS